MTCWQFSMCHWTQSWGAPFSALIRSLDGPFLMHELTVPEFVYQACMITILSVLWRNACTCRVMHVILHPTFVQTPILGYTISSILHK